MANNFFYAKGIPGTFFGSVIIQAEGKIGGTRSVFVDLTGVKDELSMPSWGGPIMNPFKGIAKFYAGDLFELRYNEKGEEGKLYLLKTFKVKSQETTTVKIYRDGYSHIPFVGDVLMKAPAQIGGTGKAYTVQSVRETTDGGKDVWEVVFNTEIDTVTDGDILVEAESENASGTMLVKTINAVAPCDGDMVFTPASSTGTDVFSANYSYTPVMHGTMYIHKMSPLPKCVLDLNKSRFNGWYEV